MLFALPDLEPVDESVIEQVAVLRRELRHNLAQRRRWVGVLRRVAFARSIHSSNSIEGIHVSLDDAVAAAAGEEPLDADEAAGAWPAIRGHREAMTYVLALADDPHFSYSSALLRSLHFMMTSYDLDVLPGRWRTGTVFVHDTVSGRTVYEGPDAKEVPALVDELVDGLNVDDDAPALARAAMAHLNLAMIHPFKDGNGRMARALQTLVLAREGILAPELASIEEYLGDHTQDYYRVLADVGGGRWQPHRDARAWLRFCLTAHFRQARMLLRRTAEAARRWEALETEATRHGLAERVLEPLFLAASGFRLRNETYRHLAAVSPSTASHDLKTLVDAGLLLAHGQKRGRQYTAGEPLRHLQEETGDKLRAEEKTDPYTQPASTTS